MKKTRIKLRGWRQSLEISKIINPDAFDVAEAMCYIPGELFGRYHINAYKKTSDMYAIMYKGAEWIIPLYFIEKIIDDEED